MQISLRVAPLSSLAPLCVSIHIHLYIHLYMHINIDTWHMYETHLASLHMYETHLASLHMCEKHLAWLHMYETHLAWLHMYEAHTRHIVPGLPHAACTCARYALHMCTVCVCINICIFMSKYVLPRTHEHRGCRGCRGNALFHCL